ncbi:MAG: glycoside hydrolase, partial [Chloroflexota bacterium]|nr:glycoside hydrolase [Chloroflexota bacterium]
MKAIPDTRTVRLIILSLILVLVSTLASPAAAQTPGAADDAVTGQTYVRHDGGTDTGIVHCNNPASSPVDDANTSDADADSNDGGSRRQGNEPFSVVDPTDPDTVVAGWNDYCLSDLGAGWQGFAFSRNSGETWTNSIVPGYPQDTSVEGRQSPLYGDHTDAGDPIAAFDNDGNLFVGGIAFNRVGAINGDVYVATYGAQDQANGYPVDYLRTRIVGRGTPSRNFQGIFQDKPMLEVDRTGGIHDGNVYVCWSRFTAFGQNKLYFSRSTDMGRTFSRPVQVSGNHSVQGCDIAVEADGDVYVTWRTFDDRSAKTRTGLDFARSTNGGASFGRAQQIRAINAYNPFDSGNRDCGDGAFHCPSDYVFHRVPLEPRVTADQTGGLGGVYLVYNEIRPGSVVASNSSYSSAGGGRVGQSLVYVIRSTNNGATWSSPQAVDPEARGHQFFPDIDANAGKLYAVYHD